MAHEIVFESRDVVKRFGATLAVNGVSIQLRRGEIRGLVGENGSGKTTLVSMIAGVLHTDAGEMLLNGKPYHPSTLIEANKQGVSLIAQEMSTIDGLSVAQNIFFGYEQEFTKFNILNSGKMNTAARELLEKYGLHGIDPTQDIAGLTFEQKKLVEFVKALYTNPDIMIVDETTTAVSQNGRQLLYAIMQQLKDAGKTVVFITHDLPELLAHCDQATILKDGEVVGAYPICDLDENRVKALMVGREYKESGKYYRDDREASFSNEVVFRVSNLKLHNAFDEIAFDLHRGEILGIGGLTGCGMHELGRALFGMVKPETGQIVYLHKGQEIPVTSPQVAIKNQIAYVSKNRDQEGLMLTSSIADNIVLPGVDRLVAKTFLNPRVKRGYAERNTRQLTVKMKSIGQLVMHLSGGNKQKVSISKWLANESEIFILDCPTRGIDVSVKAAVYQLMQDFKTQGRSVIMISEELLELIGMCDRVLMMRNGKISGKVIRGAQMTEENLIHMMV